MRSFFFPIFEKNSNTKILAKLFRVFDALALKVFCVACLFSRAREWRASPMKMQTPKKMRTVTLCPCDCYSVCFYFQFFSVEFRKAMKRRSYVVHIIRSLFLFVCSYFPPRFSPAFFFAFSKKTEREREINCWYYSVLYPKYYCTLLSSGLIIVTSTTS